MGKATLSDKSTSASCRALDREGGGSPARQSAPSAQFRIHSAIRPLAVPQRRPSGVPTMSSGRISRRGVYMGRRYRMVRVSPGLKISSQSYTGLPPMSYRRHLVLAWCRSGHKRAKALIGRKNRAAPWHRLHAQRSREWGYRH